MVLGAGVEPLGLIIENEDRAHAAPDQLLHTFMVLGVEGAGVKVAVSCATYI